LFSLIPESFCCYSFTSDFKEIKVFARWQKEEWEIWCWVVFDWRNSFQTSSCFVCLSILCDSDFHLLQRTFFHDIFWAYSYPLTLSMQFAFLVLWSPKPGKIAQPWWLTYVHEKHEFLCSLFPRLCFFYSSDF
jgi:hypothetical protein